MAGNERRQELVKRLREQIELTAVDAAQRRSEPFVILALDMDDPTAKAIATNIAGPAETEKYIANCAQQGMAACCTYDASDADLEPLFRDSKGWAALKPAIGQPGIIRVVAIADRGFSFLTLRLPD
ncbi:MAG TPA: hypothetical protein VMP01_18475 [Pirellulaceae bacterium]|nr:hypothetical protein [Pirellulaceae bacterium]